MTRARNLGEIADSSYISAVGNKVGIGSTVPQYTLDVAGNLRFTGSLYQGGSIFSSGVGIQSAGTVVGSGITTLNFIGAGNTFAVIGNRVDISISGGGSSSQWVTTSSGIHTLSNVGVGTTNPTRKLSVNGDVSIASTVSIGTTINIIPYNSLGTLSFEGSAGGYSESNTMGGGGGGSGYLNPLFVVNGRNVQGNLKTPAGITEPGFPGTGVCYGGDVSTSGKNGFARITIGGVAYTYNYSGIDLNIII